MAYQPALVVHQHPLEPVLLRDVEQLYLCEYAGAGNYPQGSQVDRLQDPRPLVPLEEFPDVDEGEVVVVDEDGGQFLVGQEGELDEGHTSLVLFFAESEQTALPCFRLGSVLEKADLALYGIAAEGDDAEVVLADILVVMGGIEDVSQILEYYRTVDVLVAGLLLCVVGVGVAGDGAEIAIGALQLA